MSSLVYQGQRIVDDAALAAVWASFVPVPSAKTGSMDDPHVQGWSYQDRIVTEYLYDEPLTAYGIGNQSFLARVLQAPRGLMLETSHDNDHDKMVVDKWIQFQFQPYNDPNDVHFIQPDLQFLIHSKKGIDFHYMGKNCHLLVLKEELEPGQFGQIELKEKGWELANVTISRFPVDSFANDCSTTTTTTTLDPSLANYWSWTRVLNASMFVAIMCIVQVLTYRFIFCYLCRCSKNSNKTHGREEDNATRGLSSSSSYSKLALQENDKDDHDP